MVDREPLPVTVSRCVQSKFCDAIKHSEVVVLGRDGDDDPSLGPADSQSLAA